MGEDKRITATKNAFRGALIELLKEKSPELITIKMICDRCGINRSTFYRHYPSVLALYQETNDAFIGELIDIINSIHHYVPIDFVTAYERALRYLSDNREECIVLLANRVLLGFEDEFDHRYIDRLNLNIRFNPSNEKEQYLHAFISAAIVNATWRWLGCDHADRISEHEMAVYISALVQNCFRRQ